MASTIELLLLAQSSGPGSAPMISTDESSIPSGNVTSATAITKLWPALPGTPAAGQVYELATEFNGVFGGVVTTFYAGIAGSFTSMAAIGGTFGASGDVINGWLKLTVRVLTATTCRLHLAGSMVDTSANSGHILTGSSGNAVPISSAVAFGITFAASDTIAVGVAFASSAAAQTIETFGSTFTRVNV